jgi:pimeloyl-ACP methyl ester carboxylesterase|tara:strand:- start:2152 stop:3054 length:903 start_codon:yes stop_codon:yes gene_type:complete
MIEAGNTQYAQSNGLKIAYESFGNPEDPAIVLVAGLYNQLVRWPLELCQHLVDRGFRVIRFDNRDIGLSDKFNGVKAPGYLRLLLKSYFGIPVAAPYNLDDMAADTVGLLDALEIPAAHLVGMSMGGMISQIVAGRYPDRVLSLTSIMSTSGERGKGEASIKVSLKMVQPASKGKTPLDIAVEIWQMLGGPAYPMTDDAIRAQVIAEYKRSSNPAGYMRQIAAIRTSPSRVTLLKSIKAPTLIIHGNQDLLVPVSGGIDTAKHIAHSELVRFEGMGHTLPDALLETFADLILKNSIATAT